MLYSGFWLRLAAFAIDLCLFIGLDMLLKQLSYDLALFVYNASTEGDNSNVNMHQTLLGMAVTWLYFTGLESSTWQATLGKRMLNLKVADENGGKIGFGRANVRYWSKILSMLIVFCGFIMIGITKRKQGLHDFIARTLVLKSSTT